MRGEPSNKIVLCYPSGQAKLYPEEPELQLRCDAVEAPRAHTSTSWDYVRQLLLGLSAVQQAVLLLDVMIDSSPSVPVDQIRWVAR